MSNVRILEVVFIVLYAVLMLQWYLDGRTDYAGLALGTIAWMGISWQRGMEIDAAHAALSKNVAIEEEET